MATKSYRTRFRDFFLRGSAVWEKGLLFPGIWGYGRRYRIRYPRLIVPNSGIKRCGTKLNLVELGLWEADSRIRHPILIVPSSGIKAMWNTRLSVINKRSPIYGGA